MRSERCPTYGCNADAPESATITASKLNGTPPAPTPRTRLTRRNPCPYLLESEYIIISATHQRTRTPLQPAEDMLEITSARPLPTLWCDYLLDRAFHPP